MKYLNKSGQISATILTIIGLLFSASSVVSWNAFNRADKAIENASEAKLQVSEVSGDIKRIKGDIEWIRDTLNNQKVLGTIATSSPINGHR